MLNEGFMTICLPVFNHGIFGQFVLFVFVFMVSISSFFIIRKTLKGITRLLQTSNEYSRALNHSLSSWRQNLTSIQDFHV